MLPCARKVPCAPSVALLLELPKNWRQFFGSSNRTSEELPRTSGSSSEVLIELPKNCRELLRELPRTSSELPRTSANFSANFRPGSSKCKESLHTAPEAAGIPVGSEGLQISYPMAITRCCSTPPILPAGVFGLQRRDAPLEKIGAVGGGEARGGIETWQEILDGHA